MYFPQRTKRSGRQATASSALRSAPVKGLNSRDPLPDMAEGYAWEMENWWPVDGGVQVRPGCKRMVQELRAVVGGVPQPTTISMLLKYDRAVGSPSYFAVTQWGSVDVSTALNGTAVLPTYTTFAGPYTDPGVGTFINFSTPGGKYLIMASGKAGGRVWFYDGTTWNAYADFPLTTGTGTLPVGTIKSVYSFKHRVFFLERGTANFYFLPIDSYTGAASKFPLGSLLSKGGNLTAFTAWTVDGGNGPDDYAVFISDLGQAIVYQGTNPGDANAWSIVGVYDLDIPAQEQCFVKYGGDVLYLSKNGPTPLSKALPSAFVGLKLPYTDKIQPTFQSAYSQLTTIPSNQNPLPVYYGSANAFIFTLNDPASGDAFYGARWQLVLNTRTGAWTKFTGWNMTSYLVDGSRLFAGSTDGGIYQLWTGGIDETPTGVRPIVAVCADAFSHFRSLGVKDAAQLRPVLTFAPIAGGTASVSVEVGLDVDFPAQTTPPAYTSTISYTPGASPVNLTWLTPTNYPGYALAARLRVTASYGTVLWSSTHYAYELGNLG